MNTNHDEHRLALWLDDELQGEELAAAEAFFGDAPEMLAAREETRRWRAMMAEGIPADQEPPYSEFFNARIARAIRDAAPEPTTVTVRRISWNAVLFPLAACAGMAFTFLLGVKTSDNRMDLAEIDVTGAPKAIPVDPILYTPESGVNAEWFTSLDASATVIVLDGLEAIPDSMDFSATAEMPMPRDIDATAGTEPEEVSDL
jgi:hypothetical protein